MITIKRENKYIYEFYAEKQQKEGFYLINHVPLALNKVCNNLNKLGI